MTHLIYFDGTITENPGGIAGYGIAIIHDGKTLITEYGPASFTDEHGNRIKAQTVNEVEYVALINALKLADGLLKTQYVTVRGDSKLVIRQMEGRWKIKSPQLRELLLTARAVAQNFQFIEFEWHPREDNWLVHDLALKGRLSKSIITTRYDV